MAFAEAIRDLVNALRALRVPEDEIERAFEACQQQLVMDLHDLLHRALASGAAANPLQAQPAIQAPNQVADDPDDDQVVPQLDQA